MRSSRSGQSPDPVATDGGDSPLLEVRDLTTVFWGAGHREQVAVDGISFSVHRGETLGVVGESGSGKSVTMLSILGLIPSRAGTVRSGKALFSGRDLLAMSRRDLQRVRGNEIAMIFQDPMTSLNPVMSVGRQIAEPLMRHRQMSTRQARERATELLSAVGIPSPGKRLDDYPHEFSGGMRQRVMIAIALSCDPQLLIADEPTTALDVTVQAQILELLSKLRSELGMAMVIVTHDLGVVAGVADRVNVMYSGEIVESGPADRIFAEPRHPYTLGLLESVPRVDASHPGDLYSIPGRPPMLNEDIVGCRFRPRCAFANERAETERPVLTPVADDPDHCVACWIDIRKHDRND